MVFQCQDNNQVAQYKLIEVPYKKRRSSSKGNENALRTVGPKPRTSTRVKIITVHKGSDVKYQNGNEASADRKNTSQSA